MPRRHAPSRPGSVLGILLACAALAPAEARQPPPTFKSGVEVVRSTMRLTIGPVTTDLTTSYRPDAKGGVQK